MSSETITRNDLKAILDEVLPSCAVDYVVEQGTSGGWTYRKWNSGLCEQWYMANPGNYTIGTARGSWYSGSDITLTYPIEFTTYPSVTGGVWLATDGYIVQLQIKGYGYTTCGFRIVSSGSIAQSSGYIVMIHAVGKWK